MDLLKSENYLKILLFTEIYDCGGVDTFLINLINHWPNDEDSFVIIANRNYPGLDIVEDNISHPCEIVRHDIPLYFNFSNNLLLPKFIKKMISPILRYIFIIFHIFAFRKILLSKKTDFLMVINGGYPGGDSCRAASLTWGLFSRKPNAIHNFHNLVVKPPWYFFLQEYLFDTALSKFTSNFVTVSRASADSMNVRRTIYTKNNTTYIHNGLNILPIQHEYPINIREQIGISPSTPLCLMLSTYEPRKGHYFLFQAFKEVLKKVPNAHLLTCGFAFPHEITQVEKYVRDFQLNDNVHLMDFRKDISHLLSNADILLVPSQAYESFGFTSVEAMAHKVPVVATNVGGIPEVVANGDGGYCVEKTDVCLFSDHIIKLLLDKDLRVEQGEKGFLRYKRLFTADKMAQDYASLIENTANLN
ncbi:MAG: glycosyltransferase family 4 protein [Planctomycetes bacterium]|nr:glycosyltransferase family 4 protein [Planctomycetota bacterium]